MTNYAYLMEKHDECLKKSDNAKGIWLKVFFLNAADAFKKRASHMPICKGMEERK